MIQNFVLAMVSVAFLVVEFAGAVSAEEPRRTRDDAVRRAIGFLAHEVPRWRVANKCYSCHNNGDAARALFEARRQEIAFDRESLVNTLAWLKQPENWRHNGGEGEFNDHQLAAIQFGASLVKAQQTGALDEPAALQRAADIVAGKQGKDGGWWIDAPGTIGSPATYGAGLATAFSLQLLKTADAENHADAIARGERWLRSYEAKNTPDAAGVLLGLAGATDEAAGGQREGCLTYLRKSQSASGGWGPYAVSRSEVFDTAIAVLALAAVDDFPKRREMMQRGQRWLIDTQVDDGSWPETTRPSGDISYAQRLSTTGWATLALLLDITPKP